MVAGNNTSVTGFGTPGSPWVISTTAGAPLLGLIYDGANGSTRPVISGNNIIICSPAGGGVPGAPSQMAVQFPGCPESSFMKMYQTSTGMRSAPAKRSTVTTFVSTVTMWPDMTQVDLNPLQGQPPIDQDTVQIHVITNDTCWPMQYFIQIHYHRDAALQSVVQAGIQEDIYPLINGVQGPKTGHIQWIAGLAGGSLVGRASDLMSSGQTAIILPLAPGASQNINVRRKITNQGGAFTQAYLRNSFYNLTILGVPI